MTASPNKIALGTTLTADSYTWNNPWGGDWDSLANWYDATIGAVATVVPTAANAVSIIGGTGGLFTDILDAGAAAALAIQNDVLIWGTVSVAGALTLAQQIGAAVAGDLELDGGATLAAGSLSVANGQLQATSASTLAVSGTTVVNQTFLLATDGSALRLASLVANNIYNAGSVYVTPLLAVDDISSIQIGSLVSATLGAISVGAGQTATISGAMEGNVVMNGVVAIQSGNTLAIDKKDPYGTAIGVTGTGSLVITEASTATLGVADSAGINFADPAGTLIATVLPTGTISGFMAGDLIELPVAGGSSVATGLSYQQLTTNTGRITLTRAGVSVGTLAMAGSYGNSLFHLSLDASGDDLITVAPVGSAPVQPSVIIGTAGADTLYATANSQALTGMGGGDLLEALGFTGIDFKDTSADLNGGTITGFGVTDTIDLTDMKLAGAALIYTAGTLATLAVNDGTHAASLNIGFAGTLAPGWFVASGDGSGGTDVKFVAVNTDTYTFKAAQSGTFAAAANWTDLNTGTVAAAAPSYGNTVVIAGGPTTYTGAIGNGVAGSIQASGDVLLWGSLSVGGTVSGVSGALSESGTLELDGGARLTLTGTAGIGGMIEIGGSSALTAGGLSFTAGGAALLAVGGGAASFTGVLGAYAGTNLVNPSVIGVDATSSIEIGSAGTAGKGALTIDSGVTADLLGTIQGSVVVNGTLAVIQGDALSITGFGTAAASVTGSGTLVIANSATLALNVADSAAIQFSPGTATVPEALALNGALPTGTISGFAKGDSIVLARTVTGATWTQGSASAGTLALLDGTVAVGSLKLAGSFSAAQFLVTPLADARGSTVTYMAAPGTASGTVVNDNTDTYTWNTGTGGAWGNAFNWLDSATGLVPSVAPGAGNAVVMPARSGGLSAAQVVSGTGIAASVLDGMDSVFTGALTVVGQFEVQGYQSEALLQGGAYLTVGTLNDQSTVAVVGPGTLVATSSLPANAIQGTLTATGGGVVQLAGAGSLYGTLAVDSLSSVEIGTAGAAALGAFTIDAGQTLAAYASLIEANLAVNGGIVINAATVTAEGFAGSVGTASGSGTIALSYADLVLGDADSAAIALGAGSVLELAGPLPTGTISGFVSGDLLKFDQVVTGASFAQTTASQGKLTLTDGTVTVGTLALAGNFAGELFQLDLAGPSGASTLSLQAAVASGAVSAPAGTGTDAYAWGGASGGTWATAANWTDTTKGTTPATSPGALDAVTVAGSFGGPNQYETIGGNGTAASLGITGNVLLKGSIGVVGRVTLTTVTGTAAELALNGGAVLSANTETIVGRLEAEAASTVKITSYTTLNAGSLLLMGGSTLTSGGLLGVGSANVIAIDATSAVHIGSTPGAAAGALTQAAGSPVALTGAVYGSVVANGTLAVAGGASLFIDLSGAAEHDPYGTPTIGGTGTLSITEASTLGLGVADTAAISFAGPNGTLVLATPATGTISGFAVGDQIQVDQTVTGLSYHQGSGSGTLTLTRGSATVGTLTLAGTYGTGNAFHLDLQSNGNVAVISLQTLGIASTQPTLITGTAGSDILSATANGQTLAGLLSPDTMNGAGFTGLDFKDLTANLNADVITGFATSDWVDFTDMTAASATLRYVNGTLSVSDGTHSANLGVAFQATPSSGSFHVAADGSGGTKLTWS